MAVIVPSRISSSATGGEKRLHKILGGLPEDWVVYYEPDIGGRRPDFVVISPELGVIVIEDKNWRSSTILQGDKSNILIQTGDGPVSVKHPELQAREYNFLLQKTAKKPRFGQRFIHRSGVYEGKLNFPITHIVTFSNISEKAFSDLGLSDIFSLERTVLRDELERWTELSADEITDVFRSYFEGLFSRSRFTPDEVKAIRMIVHPEIDLANAFSTNELLAAPRAIHDQQDVVMALDLKQEETARAIGDGHQIVYGVAGSGKTIILLVRARLLAERNPDAEILLVCYNRKLAAWMQKQVPGCEQITVSTFHKLCSGNGIPFSRKRTEAECGVALGGALKSGSRDARRFDAVLVDEAQDFEPGWFSCLLAMMKDPVDGDLLIVADGAQGLYRRNRVSWKQLGIKAQGRSHSKRFDLDRNYRNSSEILTLAETFATLTEESSDPEDGMQAIRVDAKLSLRSTGASPLLFVRSSWQAEMQTAEQLVERLVAGRWLDHDMAALAREEIAILYPRATREQKAALADLRERKKGVCVDTIHSAKGLQYRAVILLWAGSSAEGCGKYSEKEAVQLDRRLLYVGMTRAVGFLAITAEKSSWSANLISNSPACRVVGAGNVDTPVHHEQRADRVA